MKKSMMPSSSGLERLVGLRHYYCQRQVIACSCLMLGSRDQLLAYFRERCCTGWAIGYLVEPRLAFSDYSELVCRPIRDSPPATGAIAMLCLGGIT